MEYSSFLTNLAISIAIGFFIGAERESRYFEEKGKKFEGVGGIRTYIIISAIGYLAGFIIMSGYEAIGLTLIITSFIFILVSQITGSVIYKLTGLTTEFGTIFLLTLMTLLGIGLLSSSTVIILSVGLFFVLASKDLSIKVREKFAHTHILDIAKFFVAAGLILPLLPNQAILLDHIDPLISLLNSLNIDTEKLRGIELINPYSAWLVVVLISSLDIVGNILSKFFDGTKSTILSAILGGLTSSTNTTLTFAKDSNKLNKTQSLDYAAATIIANSVSFLRVLLVISAISSALFFKASAVLLPVVLAGIAFSYYMESINKSDITHQSAYKSFNIMPAIKFTLSLFFVSFLVRLALVYLGPSGFLVTSLFSSLVGLDAVALNISQLFELGQISSSFAIFTLITSCTMNLVFGKLLLLLKNGNDIFFKYVAIGFAIMIAISYFILTLL